MAKPSYLNAAQKHMITMLIACAQFLGRAIEMNPKVPRTALANLKRGRSFLQKGLDESLASLDDKTERSIWNIIRDNDIGIISKSRPGKVTDAQDEYIRDKEYAERFAEIVLQSKCQTCDGSPGPKCPIREALAHFSVPEWNPEHEICEYIGTGLVE